MITLVGAGALGSHTLMFLRNTNHSIQIIDYDKVESHNLRSQFHGKPGVGKNKAVALSGIINLLWGIKYTINPNRLTEQNTNELLSNSDLIIDCLDNSPSRHLVQNYACKHQIPCLHGALAANGAFGRIIWTEQFIIDENVGGTATCDDGNYLPFIGLVSALIAKSAFDFLDSNLKNNFQILPSGVVIKL
jgi:molybdopterin/thiamine biosynthesis adenylyltransferase